MRASFLPVSGGHSIYFEEHGFPDGIPVLFLHGGPGSGCRPEHRAFFDPQRFRAILFDQRGSGRSTPAGCIASNTTPDLVADIEALRRELGIDRWIVFGGSWGATLALAYAVCHRPRVAGMVLRGVFLGSAKELDWYLNGLGAQLPKARTELDAILDAEERTRPIAALAQRVNSPDPVRRDTAALAWLRYEAATMGVEPPQELTAESRAKAAVQLHYLAHACFLDSDKLQRELPLLGGIPVVVVQGALDRICPPAAARAVAAGVPEARLMLLPEQGHSTQTPEMKRALADALDQVAAKYGNS